MKITIKELQGTLKILNAYLDTNEEYLEYDDIEEIKDLIDLFTVESEFQKVIQDVKEG